MNRQAGVVWDWGYSGFGEDLPVAGRLDSGQDVTFNLRFAGQYFDAESGLHYNGFRSYDPLTGRYTQADPIGLDGGWNRFGYVAGNPLGYADPLGLFTVVSNGFPAEEAALRSLGDRIQGKISSLCEQARLKLQPIFDKWVVSVDARVRELNRNRSDYAFTDYANHSTKFYSAFFAAHPHLRQGGSPSQSIIGYHEFRHLMKENRRLDPGGSAYAGALLTGKAGGLAIEQDADAFASKMVNGDCSCAD